ncbi:Gpi18-like mannosyltransferase [Clostridium acetobutylicum]|uniref:Uncharacterized membrane protein n=1 Tax=Clostridium acetobutylicum (strain ATCC 824 / DSM 792 / JCM 1419 / IAM 19013 / LMG 5710 / NBRC 13948 / NRRL B-527 / VKM B-1787 / 2291 / W) TaxID=272562 RepID=Q97M46_CLOAB|nr:MULTISPECIES: glycosyltransferase 87 family protein [Clostridium]AAK78334.1 Uncharacterized membrane protein [Clostridium acetobutylicum ATCC 824]ADZ19403.1 Conserved hypothetical protein [Clostridium acetobutylicum EA 2018]AEI31193.1 hypothetical protein SMB_G0362 [Clostridium acetobutylicum DSM 1731]AWV80059.1 DUF2029 domain-containing protein [Clostridium acetobutylicum]MBC2395880.1 DUF2029 domain-containing protein [Clostridium acetobutylicum]
METLKKNWTKFILSFIMLVLAIICVYTLSTYKSSEKNTGFLKMGGGFNKSFNSSSRKLNGQPNMKGAPAQHPSNSNANSKSAPPNNFNHNVSKPQRMMGGGEFNSSSKYSSEVLIYSLGFFAIVICAYLAIVKKKIKISTENRGFILAAFLVIGFLFRIIVGLLITGYVTDIGLYKQWALTAAKNLAAVYTNGSVDYPPVYLYVLSIIGKIASSSFMSNYSTLLIKLPSIIADIFSAYFVYRLSIKRFSYETSFALTLFYLFNPAILINSTLWGQADSFFTLLVILAVYFISEDKIVPSSIFFALSVLMKPQGIIFLPLVLFWYIKNKNLKSIFKSIASGFITTIIVLAPFSISKGNITWIFDLYTREVSEYPYASNNAFNFYSLIGANRVKDSNTMFIFSYHTWGMLFIVLITLISGFFYLKSKNKYASTLAALIQVVGVFNFSVGMHERYMFTAVLASILAYIYFKDKRLLLISLLLSFINYANMHTILFNRLNMNVNSSSSMLIVFISLLNITTFVYLIKVCFDLCLKKDIKVTEDIQNTL